MPRRTASTSAPTKSARLAISFMNEMRVASMALAAYLVSSALGTSIHTIRSWWRLSEAYKRPIASLACSPIGVRGMPTTMRSGCMKSSMAAPSFKNSGLDTTTNGRSALPQTLSSAATAWVTRSAVPTGTVDLFTMTMGPVMARATCCAAAITCARSAEPSSCGGVPTAMNMISAWVTAAGMSPVKLRRLPWVLRTIRASRPGS